MLYKITKIPLLIKIKTTPFVPSFQGYPTIIYMYKDQIEMIELPFMSNKREIAECDKT